MSAAIKIVAQGPKWTVATCGKELAGNLRAWHVVLKKTANAAVIANAVRKFVNEVCEIVEHTERGGIMDAAKVEQMGPWTTIGMLNEKIKNIQANLKTLGDIKTESRQHLRGRGGEQQ